MKLETVVVEQPIEASAERIWQRIATPDGLARWWRPGDIAAVVGHEFTMDMDSGAKFPGA